MGVVVKERLGGAPDDPQPPPLDLAVVADRERPEARSRGLVHHDVGSAP